MTQDNKSPVQGSRGESSGWAVLNNHFFRSLWIANVASGIGSAIHDTAATWTMATLTTSATMVTLMQTASSLPLFLFALPVGALADIIDRRKLIIAAQVGSLLVAAGLAGIVWMGRLNPGLLLAATFLLGVGTAFATPAWQALLVEVVERRDLSGAITLGSISVNIARAVGPIIGGLIVATAGPTAAFLLNAISFAGIIAVLSRWKREPQKAGARSEQMLGAIVAALRYARHSTAIHAVLIRSGSFAFFGIAPIALLPLIVKGRQLGAFDFGALMGAYGVGGILTAFLFLPKLRARYATDHLLLGAGSISVISIVLLAWIQRPLIMGLVLFAAGAAWLTCMSTMTIVAQNAFPNWVRARSSAIYLVTVQAALALGALLWGQVTAYSSMPSALRLAAGGLIASLLFVRIFPLNPILKLDLAPSQHWAGHQLMIEPAAEDGPVLVSIDYEVPAENSARFLQAIARLRTTRLRDGAFRWSLFRDLGRPTHFRESFLVGSWGEHLRQHDRATVDDRIIEEAVISLHTGPKPPSVTHFLMNDIQKTSPKTDAPCN